MSQTNLKTTLVERGPICSTPIGYFEIALQQDSTFIISSYISLTFQVKIFLS